MAHSTSEITLELTPTSRVDVIDVSARVAEQYGNVLSRHQKALYCSYHTTAGYFEQSFCHRLNHDRASLEAYVQSFKHLFPPGASYRHDQLELRSELSEEQRKVEPQNADSHLTFIGSGLENCVTYRHRPSLPVYFIDLDGINGPLHRTRQTTIIGYDDERDVETLTLDVPVSKHRIDSINLRDRRLGLYEQLTDLIQRYGIAKGRIDISLDPGERNVGLTVNEYETLLMKHDLIEVLKNPVRFMAEKGRNMLRDPRAIPSKAKNYAKYDLVHFVNEVIDALGLSESLVERIIDKFIAVPASRFLRMKRSLSLMVNNTDERGLGSIVQGTYQSPILVQWKRTEAPTRRLTVRLVSFD